MTTHRIPSPAAVAEAVRLRKSHENETRPDGPDGTLDRPADGESQAQTRPDSVEAAPEK
jgi:hypothetical protein